VSFRRTRGAGEPDVDRGVAAALRPGAVCLALVEEGFCHILGRPQGPLQPARAGHSLLGFLVALFLTATTVVVFTTLLPVASYRQACGLVIFLLVAFIVSLAQEQPERSLAPGGYLIFMLICIAFSGVPLLAILAGRNLPWVFWGILATSLATLVHSLQERLLVCSGVLLLLLGASYPVAAHTPVHNWLTLGSALLLVGAAGSGGRTGRAGPVADGQGNLIWLQAPLIGVAVVLLGELLGLRRRLFLCEEEWLELQGLLAVVWGRLVVGMGVGALVLTPVAAGAGCETGLVIWGQAVG
jgi:hypothetical protein